MTSRRRHNNITPWTQAEKDDFVAMHEKVLLQYPDKDTIIGGKVYNIVRELRADRIKFLAGIPTV